MLYSSLDIDKNWGTCAVKKKLTAARYMARPSICIIHSIFLSVLSKQDKVIIANVIFLIKYPTLNFWQKLGYLRCEEEGNSSLSEDSSVHLQSVLSKWDKDRIANVVFLITYPIQLWTFGKNRGTCAVKKKLVIRLVYPSVVFMLTFYQYCTCP